jgi:metal-responsive CopG/Arc/MetJ family transcriptional regulator
MITKSPRRYLTGITIEPEVREYVDALAAQMRMSRSWVINTLIREYATLMQRQNLQPFQHVSIPEPIIRL